MKGSRVCHAPPTGRCTQAVVCRQGRGRQAVSWGVVKLGRWCSACAQMLHQDKGLQAGYQEGDLQAGQYQGKARRGRRLAGQSHPCSRRGMNRGPPEQQEEKEITNEVAGPDIAAMGARFHFSGRPADATAAAPSSTRPASGTAALRLQSGAPCKPQAPPPAASAPQ